MSDTPFEPLKGDPDRLRSKAEHYRNIGDAIARSVITLRKISEVDSMKSKAVDAVRDSSEDVAKDIDKAKDRYQQTAKALIDYSAALRIAQDDADAAIAQIGDKQQAADSAHRAATTAQDQADDASDADKSDKTTAADQASDKADAADAALSAAHKAWHDAEDAKNNAADIATKLIVEVVDGAKKHGLEDSWWDDWGADLLNIIKVICDIAGILSIFLAWVPILGQILLVLAAVGAIISLVESICKAVTGEGSWWAVLGAAGMAVLTIFGGKIFAIAAKQLKASAVVASGVRKTSQLRSLQGVGKGSSEFMSFKAAQNVLKKTKLVDGFKQPFTRQGNDVKLFHMYKDGRITANAAFKSAAKEGLPGLKLDWKGALGINNDLLGAAKMAQHLTGGQRVAGVALAGFQMYTTETKVISLGKDLGAPDPFSLTDDGAGFVKGEYGKFTGLAKDVNTAVRGLV